MFADGYFSLSFAELIGFAITIVSVWLVIRQLNETRLASQMEGAISLATMAADMEKQVKALVDFTLLEEWEKLDDEDAYAAISRNDEYMEGYLKHANIFGLTGGLVRAGALDLHVAEEQFGYFLPVRWRRFEKFTRVLRKKFGEEMNENWEWLALEFEKLQS